jgi:hypothetical protein
MLTTQNPFSQVMSWPQSLFLLQDCEVVAGSTAGRTCPGPVLEQKPRRHVAPGPLVRAQSESVLHVDCPETVSAVAASSNAKRNILELIVTNQTEGN